jgi:hypothetical protein
MTVRAWEKMKRYADERRSIRSSSVTTPHSGARCALAGSSSFDELRSDAEKALSMALASSMIDRVSLLLEE